MIPAKNTGDPLGGLARAVAGRVLWGVVWLGAWAGGGGGFMNRES